MPPVIPQDKIVMVTGDPRSGTSLMMKTLQLLGVPSSPLKAQSEVLEPHALSRPRSLGPQLHRSQKMVEQA